jgi:polyphosphate glucokinase
MAIDIGGSGLKAMLLDAKGKPVSERQRVVTPAVPTPDAVLKPASMNCASSLPFDRVSVGFPGVVKHGCTYGASTSIRSGQAASRCRPSLKSAGRSPSRVGNDADVAGYGAIKGTASSWCSPWAPASAQPSSPTAISAPASNSATTSGAKRA